MDPIHPILPTQVTIPPVTPAPMTARIDRDARREATEHDRRAREERRRRSASELPPEGEADDLDEDGPHIDLTA